MHLAASGLSYAGLALVLCFVLVAWWEHARPGWQPTAPTGRRWIANLGLYALCAAATLGLKPFLAPLVAAGSTLSPGALVPEGGLAAALHFFVVVLALDLAYYFTHRLFHALSVLWRLHAIHHTDRDLDLTTTLRHHPLEVLVIAVITAGIGAVLGASAGEVALYGMLAFGIQLMAHGNLELPPWLSSALDGLVLTPRFHRLHHSLDQRESDANFAEVFTIWDRLFGTLAKSRDGPTGYGVSDYLSPRFQSFLWMLVQPAIPLPSRPPEASR